MDINRFFGQINYINLDKRIDRRKRMDQLLKENDIHAERVTGIVGNAWNWKTERYPHPLRAFDGVAGGTSTQIDILIRAMKAKKPSVLILEDDCEFIEDFRWKFTMWSDDVPEDWDLLYLGGMGGKGMPYIEGIVGHVLKVTNMMATHAYAVNQKAYITVINAMYDKFPYLEDSADGYLRKLQPTLNTYAFNPPMIWQKADYSDIQHGHRDYTDQFKRPLI